MVTWTYTVAAGAVDDLAAGQTITQVYTVTVTDSSGATDTETVTIVITGTNDAPVINGGPVAGNLTEDFPTLNLGGQVTVTDPDQGAIQTWKVVGGTDFHAADYSFAIDNLKIVRDSSTVVDDSFTSAPANGDGSYSLSVNGVPGTLAAGTDGNGRSVSLPGCRARDRNQRHRLDHAVFRQFRDTADRDRGRIRRRWPRRSISPSRPAST